MSQIAQTAQTSPPELTERAAELRLAIVRTARRMRQEAGSDLGPSTIAALGAIEREGPLTPSELADYERIKRPTATRILARLSEDELVTRAADPADGRCSIVSVTPAGAALLKRLRGHKNAYLAKRMRDLPDEDLDALQRAAEVLERLLEQDRTRGSGAR